MSTGAWPKAQTSSKEDEMPPKQEKYKFFVVSTIVQLSASSKILSEINHQNLLRLKNYKCKVDKGCDRMQKLRKVLTLTFDPDPS